MRGRGNLVVDYCKDKSLSSAEYFDSLALGLISLNFWLSIKFVHSQTGKFYITFSSLVSWLLSKLKSWKDEYNPFNLLLIDFVSNDVKVFNNIDKQLIDIEQSTVNVLSNSPQLNSNWLKSKSLSSRFDEVINKELTKDELVTKCEYWVKIRKFVEKCTKTLTQCLI